MRAPRLALLLLLPQVFGSLVLAQPTPADLEKLEKQRCPKPTEFARVFSTGYGGNSLPTDDARFEALLVKLKEGGFTVVQTTYSEKRVELCKKHGLQIMVDFQAPEHHVYKSVEQAKVVAEKLKGHSAVWGYSIWNDTIAKTSEGRKRDINNIRTWDPTHPAYIGTYRTAGMSKMTNADLIGYYDYHWERGREAHFGHLLAFSRMAKDRDAYFYAWLASKPGIPGKGNFNRSLYSANTSIACGLKGILWFLGGDLLIVEKLEWTEAGKDIQKVHAEIAPLSKELAAIGNPSAIYSTTITKTMNNDPLPGDKKEMMPPGLDQNAFPKDFWLQPKAGEFVVGVFQRDAMKKAGHLFLANHNAYAEQAVELEAKGVKLEHFSRRTGKWEPLPLAGTVARVSLAQAGGELLRFTE